MWGHLKWPMIVLHHQNEVTQPRTTKIQEFKTMATKAIQHGYEVLVPDEDSLKGRCLRDP